MEKDKLYGFKILFNAAETARFEAFARETGMKKLAIVRKAILRYIEENEQEAQK